MDKLKIHRLTAVVIVYAVCSIMALMLVNSGFAQSSKKNKGLNFQVPDDWPIEERGGLLGPIPIDEYVTMKFEKVETKFSEFKSDLTEKFDTIKKSLENIEFNVSKEIKNIKADLSAPKGPGGDMTEVLVRLGELENQIARIDRKITNKSLVLKGQIEAVARDIEAIETRISNHHAQTYSSGAQE